MAALRRAAALAEGDPEIAAMLGEAMVWAADGAVPADAVRVFEAVRAARPAHPSARFHLALAHAQAGRIRRAYDMWRALAAETPVDAPWRADLAAMIRQAAAALGEAGDPLPDAAPSGPTAEERAAAAEMAPEERAAMIRAMVEGLAARLADAPDDLAGWRRLARSWRVLGEAALAARAELLAAVLEARDRAGAGAGATDPLWLQGVAAFARGADAEARGHWGRLLARLPPGTPPHETLRAALDALPPE